MTKDSKHSIDMLNGPILTRLCGLALPIALSGILQQLFNSADTAVAGKFASAQAMAAVGSNASVINLIVTLFVGLSIGANVVVASMIGSGHHNRVKDAVQTAMTIAVISGVFLTFFGMIVAPKILRLISCPPDVIGMAEEYLRLYFLGMPFVMIYNFGSAVLRAEGDSRRPLYSLIVAGCVNVVLNLYFVIVWHMAAAGVGLATTISNMINAGLVLFFLIREKGYLHLDIRKPQIDRGILRKMIGIGLPAGIQGAVFSISNVVIQSAINSFGSSAVAGSAAAQNFEFICWFMLNGFGQAATTFTSQNFAACNKERCNKIYVRATAAGMGLTIIMSFVFFMGRYPLLHIFTSSPEVMKYALARLIIVAAMEALAGTYEISGGCLRGMGMSMIPAVETLFGSCILRLVFVWTIFRIHHNFYLLMAIYPITWVITGIIVTTTYLLTRDKIYLRMGRHIS